MDRFSTLSRVQHCECVCSEPAATFPSNQLFPFVYTQSRSTSSSLHRRQKSIFLLEITCVWPVTFALLRSNTRIGFNWNESRALTWPLRCEHLWQTISDCSSPRRWACRPAKIQFHSSCWIGTTSTKAISTCELETLTSWVGQDESEKERTYAPGPSHVHVTVSNAFGYFMQTGCTGTPG